MNNSKIREELSPFEITISLAALFLLFAHTGFLIIIYYRHDLFPLIQSFWVPYLKLRPWIEPALFFCSGLSLLIIRKGNTFSFLRFHVPNWKIATAIALISTVAAMTFNIFTMKLISTADIPFFLRLIQANLKSIPVELSSFIIDTIKYFIFTAFLGEVFWRGTIQNLITQFGGPLFAIITTSFIQGMCNMQLLVNQGHFPYESILSALLNGYIYHKYRSIWYAMITNVFTVWIPYYFLFR